VIPHTQAVRGDSCFKSTGSGLRQARLLECPRNTGIPGRRPGRRIPGRLVGIVSLLEAKFSEKLFENRPGSTT